MVQPTSGGENEEGTELLMIKDGVEPDREVTWRLNFDGFRRLDDQRQEKATCGLQDCLGVLGPEDVVAKYYQQQVEMLEGFDEMDTLTDRGFLPGMSKEERDKVARSENNGNVTSSYIKMEHRSLVELMSMIYIGGREKEAEVVADIDCSGHGRAYVDGINVDGVPIYECNTCYISEDCFVLLPDCPADMVSSTTYIIT